jgi:hypothetical protein
MKKIVLTFGLISGAISAIMMLITVPFADKLGFGKGEIIGYTLIVISCSSSSGSAPVARTLQADASPSAAASPSASSSLFFRMSAMSPPGEWSISTSCPTSPINTPPT